MRSLRKSLKPQRVQMSEEKHKGQWNRSTWQEAEVVLRDGGGEVTKDWLLKSLVHHAGVKCVSCSVMSDSVTPWTVSHQVPLSLEFFGQEHWMVAMPFSRRSCWPGIEPRSPVLQADSLLSEPPDKPMQVISQFSQSVLSNSLWPHGLQHTRLPVHHQRLVLV